VLFYFLFMPVLARFSNITLSAKTLNIDFSLRVLRQFDLLSGTENREKIQGRSLCGTARNYSVSIYTLTDQSGNKSGYIVEITKL